MNMHCVNQTDLCVTRGTDFSLDVSFTTAWTEVIENPSDYYGQLVFRDYDGAEATVYLTLSAPIDTSDPEAPAQLHFAATPTQTALLPSYDIAHYCDLMETASGGSIRRLFEGKVRINE